MRSNAVHRTCVDLVFSALTTPIQIGLMRFNRCCRRGQECIVIEREEKKRKMFVLRSHVQRWKHKLQRLLLIRMQARAMCKNIIVSSWSLFLSLSRCYLILIVVANLLVHSIEYLPVRKIWTHTTHVVSICLASSLELSRKHTKANVIVETTNQPASRLQRLPT